MRVLFRAVEEVLWPGYYNLNVQWAKFSLDPRGRFCRLPERNPGGRMFRDVWMAWMHSLGVWEGQWVKSHLHRERGFFITDRHLLALGMLK